MSQALRVFPLLLVVGATACSERGCESPGAASRERIEILGERIAVADKSWDGLLLELGSPKALPLLEDGWSYGEVAPDGSSFRWATAERASFHFESEREGTHFAWLECEPFVYPGSPTQWVGLVLNGRELAPIELRPGRDRYPLQLPLVRGENRVEVKFRYAGEPSRSRADKRRLAVAFYRLEIPFEDARDRVGPFALVASKDGAPGVFLPAGGRLTFYLERATPARLRLTLGADEPLWLKASPRSRVTVRLSAASGELWSDAFAPTDETRGEAVFERELDALGEGPVELSFEAGPESVVVRPELFVSAPSAPPSARTASSGSDRPNIVLIVLDGANALRMGLYGSEVETTPSIDALAKSSVVFDVAVSQAVYTVASVGSLLTGQYPDRHQSVSFADRLREDVATFPGRLSGSGYRTAAFVGNAVVSKVFGLDRGYDEFVPVWEEKDYSGHGDSVAKAFERWLEAAPREPYFAYVHFREPHFPYNPPPPFDQRFAPGTLYPEGIRDFEVVDDLNREAAAGRPPSEESLRRIRALYEGNLAYVDELVGRMVETIEKTASGRETAVILTADHGEALFEHGFLGHNTQLYEESIRVPLVIRVPKAPPRRVPELVELIDLTPTILELAGVPVPAESPDFQGRSLVPLLFDPSPGPDARDRLAFTRTVWAQPRYSVRGSRFKRIWDSRTGASELYDLETDPKERRDLSGTKPILEGYLRQRLFLWYRTQERLKALAPAPEGAVISEEQRRMLESLGYAGQLTDAKERER